MEQARYETTFAKVDPERRMVFGWSYVAKNADGSLAHDSGGVGTPSGHVDVIDTDEAIEAMENAFYDYALDSRAADLDHETFGVAQLVEQVVFTPEKIEKMGLDPASVPVGVWSGWYLPETPDGNRALAAIKDGKRGLSVVGGGVREALDG